MTEGDSQPPKQPSAEDLIFGRWPELLICRGMSDSYFSGKNGPCPLCGGSDRFRWVQKKYGGVWVCSQCTEGRYASGFKLLMSHMGYSKFIDAANDVRDFFSVSSNIRPIPREQRERMMNEMTPERIERNRARMLRFWNEARPITVGDPVYLYLNHRVPGAMNRLVPQTLRYHPALEYWAPPSTREGKPVSLGKFPAMLAYAQGPDGHLAQLHKTYLTEDGQKADVPLAKKTDLGIGLNSFAIRLVEPLGDTLGVAEGIETGYGSLMERDVPVWPCLNGSAMAAFELPEYLRGQIKRLIVFADSDELKPCGRNEDGSTRYHRPGMTYANQLAIRARQQGLRSLIVKPAKVGTDMASYYKERAVA